MIYAHPHIKTWFWINEQFWWHEMRDPTGSRERERAKKKHHKTVFFWPIKCIKYYHTCTQNMFACSVSFVRLTIESSFHITNKNYATCSIWCVFFSVRLSPSRSLFLCSLCDSIWSTCVVFCCSTLNMYHPKRN